MRYGRGEKEKKYLKAVLSPQLHGVMQGNRLDIAIDPISIHRTSIAAEETQSGRPSNRAYDVDRQEALTDLKTRNIYIERKFFQSSLIHPNTDSCFTV